MDGRPDSPFFFHPHYDHNLHIYLPDRSTIPASSIVNCTPYPINLDDHSAERNIVYVLEPRNPVRLRQTTWLHGGFYNENYQRSLGIFPTCTPILFDAFEYGQLPGADAYGQFPPIVTSYQLAELHCRFGALYYPGVVLSLPCLAPHDPSEPKLRSVSVLACWKLHDTRILE